MWSAAVSTKCFTVTFHLRVIKSPEENPRWLSKPLQFSQHNTNDKRINFSRFFPDVHTSSRNELCEWEFFKQYHFVSGSNHNGPPTVKINPEVT